MARRFPSSCGGPGLRVTLVENRGKVFRLMQIGHAKPGLSSQDEPEEDFEEQVRIIFQESLGLVHATLVTQYRIEESEAGRLERDLSVGFPKFCRRPGLPPPRTCRHNLIVMACVFARGLQRQRIENGAVEPDEWLDAILRQEPVEIAREVSRPLKILYHRLHDTRNSAYET